MAVTRALVCVVSSLQGVVKTSGYTLRRLCLPEGDRCQTCNKQKSITCMHVFPMFQLLYCLAHLHSFIYLLMWHFCYTEHVSGLVAREREREIDNSKSFGIVHRKARKTTFQRRDKYLFCMYCINNDLKFTFAYMFSEISDL